MKKKNNNFLYILLALVIVLVIIIWLITLGNINFISSQPNKNEVDGLMERRKRLAQRHRKLQVLIDAKTQLKAKLEKKFRRFYFIVRLVIFCLLLGFNIIIISLKWATELGTILNWNEAVLLILFGLNFLIYGNVVGIKESIDSAKSYIENKVYRKYLNIEVQIARHTSESDKLLDELTDIEEEIRLLSPVEHLISKV
jgi:hypothetical protein